MVHMGLQKSEADFFGGEVQGSGSPLFTANLKNLGIFLQREGKANLRGKLLKSFPEPPLSNIPDPPLKVIKKK